MWCAQDFSDKLTAKMIIAPLMIIMEDLIVDVNIDGKHSFQCSPGGRFAIGAGNSIPSYIPVENYLTMLDEALQ